MEFISYLVDQFDAQFSSMFCVMQTLQEVKDFLLSSLPPPTPSYGGLGRVTH